MAELPFPKALDEAKRRLEGLRQSGLITGYMEEPEPLGDDVYAFTMFAQWESPKEYAEIVGRVGIELINDSEADHLFLANVEPNDGN